MTGRQVSQLSGELVAAPLAIDVPFAAGVDLDALKALDPEPRFATVKIKPGRGQQGKGKTYSVEVLRDIARQVNEKRPSGYKGHQDTERVGWEWREPVTAWLGARFDEQEQVLYVKGYVPPTAPELRAQLDMAAAGADVVNSVSIWGMRKDEGDDVKSFDLWSIDWTPKGRAGMDTELVSVSGEQTKETTVDRDEVIRSLKVDEIPDHLADQLKAEGRKELAAAEKLLGEMRLVLELEESDDADAVLAKVKEIVDTAQVSDFQERVASKVDAEVTGELMKAAITERVASRLSPNADDETIAGEIATAKELPHIKVLQQQRIPTFAGGGSGDAEGDRKGTVWS